MKRCFGFLLVMMILFVSAASGELLTSPAGGGSMNGSLFSEAVANPDMISATLVSSGRIIWHFSGDDLVCSDTPDPKDVARLPFTSLYAEEPGSAALQGVGLDPGQATVVWLKLLPRDESGITFFLVLADQNDDAHVLMYDLDLSDGQIVISGVRDTTGTLGQFFAPDRRGCETNMTRLSGGRLLIGAMDPDFQYHLYILHSPEDSPAEILTDSLVTFLAAVPYGDEVLLVRSVPEDASSLELSTMDPETGELGNPEIISTSTDIYSTLNCAWSEEEHLLCYAVGATAYRITPGSGASPVAMQIFDVSPAICRLGLIVGDRYYVCAEDGSMVSCDLRAEITATRIRIADATGNEELSDLASGFSKQQKNYLASVSSFDDENTILELLMNQSPDYDIYVICTDSGLYSSLNNKGYFTDLGGIGTIRDAVADMTETVRSLASENGRLAGLPILTQNVTLSLNVKAMQELTGLSREEIPADWPGMLRLLNQLAEDGILAENPQYMVFEEGITSSELKEGFFALIMSDGLLWMNQSGATPDALASVLLPSLKEFETIPWDKLGVSDEAAQNMDWLTGNDQIPLLQLVPAEVVVMDLDDGVEYWPLSLTSDCPRLIPETVSVMLISPWSLQSKAALAFLEYAWNNLGILARMSLCQSLNEPIVNTEFDGDILYLEQLVASYQESIEAAKTEADAEMLRREAAEVQEYLEEYRANANMLASEKSIAAYRTLSRQFAPAVSEFWSADEEDNAVLQFLDGLMPAEQFVAQYVSVLKMALLEGD